MTVMAAVALGGLFSACSSEIEGTQAVSAEFDIVQNYEKAFITRFGQPHENQTWGFGAEAGGTRATVSNPYVSPSVKTYNATIAQAWLGVDAAIATGTSENVFSNKMGTYSQWRGSGWSDQFYDVHGTVVDSNLSDEYIDAVTKVIVGTGSEKGLIPEGENNLSKAQETGYSIVTDGGPVTLTPIYHNSNSGDRLSYYYYPKGQRPNDDKIKTMPKYSLGEMSNPASQGNTSYFKKTYSLVYVDENGNCSYNFPKGYVINFVISNTWAGQHQDIYKSGGITTTLEGSEPTLTSQGKYEVKDGDFYEVGSDKYIDGKLQIRIGNKLGIPQFTAAEQGSSFTSDGTTFGWYLKGNGINGSLNGGNTCYYLKPEADGTINVGVKLNSGKKFYIKDLGNSWDAMSKTTGTSLTGYDGKTVSSDYVGTYSFDVEAWHVYAVYAEGSKLGFYGFEFTPTNGEKQKNGVFTSALGPFDCGFSIKLGSVTIQLGRTPGYFNAAKSNGDVNGYQAYTSGTGKDGGLSGMATTYYFLAWNPGIVRVAVSLGEGKRFYIKDLGENGWNNTNGTSLAGYDGITVASKYNGTYDFPVEANHVYAVYAEEAKLGFYGCEYLTSSGGTASLTTTSEVVWENIAVTPDYYSDGKLNKEVHSTNNGYGLNEYSHGITDPYTSHTAVFKSGDYTFIGFEDWIDFDFNDVIFAITGTEPEKPQEDIKIPDPEPEPEENTDPDDIVCRIIVEDLSISERSDFDFNDVVFDVCHNGILIIRAIGGELPIYIGAENANEVHAACKIPLSGNTNQGKNSHRFMMNTGWQSDANSKVYEGIDYHADLGHIDLKRTFNTPADALEIGIWVHKNGENIKLKAPRGKVASMVCVGTDYEWCAERQDIDDKYHKGGVKLFHEYVIGNPDYQGDWKDKNAWYHKKNQ